MGPSAKLSPVALLTALQRAARRALPLVASMRHKHGQQTTVSMSCMSDFHTFALLGVSFHACNTSRWNHDDTRCGLHLHRQITEPERLYKAASPGCTGLAVAPVIFSSNIWLTMSVIN